MKFKILILAVLTALIGVDAKAAAFPPFTDPQGYLNVYSLFNTAGGKGGYLTGYGYGVADQRAISGDKINWEILPNIIAYANAATTNDIIYWTNTTDPAGLIKGPDGNKWMEMLTYYDLSVPPGVTGCVFNVTVTADDLDARYKDTLNNLQPRIFIKVLEPTGSWPVLVQDYTPLNGPGSYTVDQEITPALYTKALQVGFIWEGRNANPVDDWGSISVTVNNLEVFSGDFAAPTPAPDFINGTPTAVSDSSITMTSSTASDPSGVEYMFENNTLGYNSGWQAGTTWVDLGPLGPPTTGDVEVVTDPNYLGVAGSFFWEGWANPGGAVAPSTFVSVNAGVATVTPTATLVGDINFYHSFMNADALEIGQAYEFSIVSDNSTLSGISSNVMFVKAFNGTWGEIAAERQDVTLLFNGTTQTISFTPVSGAFYQIGTFTIGAGAASGSYDLSSPSLIAVGLVQEGPPAGLTPLTTYDYRVRARDLSTATNTTAWSAISQETTLAGDTDAPSPDPMTFSVIDPSSSQSVKMTATTATDASAVQYYFECVSGDGVDSGWQSSPVYIDTGLAADSNFTYRVRVRDLSLNQNTNQWSSPVVITTQPYPLSVSLANSLKGFNGDSNQDGTVHEILKADLSFTDYLLPRRVSFDSFGAKFGSFTAGDNGRNIIRTLANDYAAADFEAYVTASGYEADEQIFIGFGPGILGAYGVPDWSPNAENTGAAVICQLNMQSTSGDPDYIPTPNAGIWAQTNNSVANWAYDAESVLGLTSGSVQRIKMSYNATANEVTLGIDQDYNGVTFNPTVTVGPVTVPALTESRVYIAGDDGIILSDFEIVGGSAPLVQVTDLSIVSYSGGVAILQWTGVSGQSYNVVYKNSLTAATWTNDAGNQGITGVGSIATPSAVAGDDVFYQVITQ